MDDIFKVSSRMSVQTPASEKHLPAFKTRKPTKYRRPIVFLLLFFLWMYLYQEHLYHHLSAWIQYSQRTLNQALYDVGIQESPASSLLPPVLSIEDKVPSVPFTPVFSPVQHTQQRPPFSQPVSCSKAPPAPQDRRQNKTILTVGNYNAEWLFLSGGSGSMTCPGQGCPWKTEQQAQGHLDKIARVIADLGFPDILHLSEIENCATLDHLVQVIHAIQPVGYVAYMVPGQNVGLLTKIDPVQDLLFTTHRVDYPIPGSTCGHSDPDQDKMNTGVSKHYITRFVVNQVPIVVVGAHLIAFPNRKDRCEKREAQAKVLYEYLRQWDHQSQIMIMGDFNDFDGEIPDPAGILDRPISTALSILKQVSDPPLINLASTWPNTTERYSFWLDRNNNCKDDQQDEHTLIDHILISRGLLDRLMTSYPVHSYKEYCGTLDSDHWPLFASFNMAH